MSGQFHGVVGLGLAAAQTLGRVLRCAAGHTIGRVLGPLVGRPAATADDERTREEAPARSRPAGLPPAPRRSAETGMATAEYAIAMLAACGFAGLLIVILRSDQVRTLLFGIVRRALWAV